MWPAVLPMFTTWPRRRATMCGRIARVTFNSPFRLVSIIRSQSSGSPSWILARPLASPALLSSTSGTWSAATSSAVAPFTAARSRTSTCASRAATPCPRSSSAPSSAKRSRRRAQRTRLAPSAAKRRAQAAPIPELAPVMRMSFPRTRFMPPSWSRLGELTRAARARGRPRSAHVAGMAQRVSPRLGPYAQAVRLPPHRDPVRQPPGRGIEHVDFPVVPARQPQLRAIRGDVAHVGAAAARDRPRRHDRARRRIEHRDASRAAAPAPDRVPPAVRDIQQPPVTTRIDPVRPLPRGDEADAAERDRVHQEHAVRHHVRHVEYAPVRGCADVLWHCPPAEPVRIEQQVRDDVPRGEIELEELPRELDLATRHIVAYLLLDPEGLSR